MQVQLFVLRKAIARVNTRSLIIILYVLSSQHAYTNRQIYEYKTHSISTHLPRHFGFAAYSNQNV